MTFPLRYFYGESANAIKVQIWGTLIVNLLLSVLQSSLTRRWSFSGLATMVRIVLMYYINLENFFNQPDADLRNLKSDFRLGRNFYKGVVGDAVNLLLAAKYKRHNQQGHIGSESV